MSDFRASSRYAKSLLELAKEQGVLEEVNLDMKLFTLVCEQNYDFVLMLKNPVIKHDKKKAILNAIFKGKVNDLTIAIFNIIARKNREAIMPGIAREFQLQYNILKNIGMATVTTAVPLDKALKAELEAIVKQVSGQDKVKLEEIVNEEIIGGFILKMDDKQIDDSVRTKLKSLANKLGKHSYNKEI